MSLAMKAKQRVKKKTVKDKIFGCDLLEHLQMSGQEVPQVLKSCTEFVEEHGIVDGIYRLCGIASNVQKLRQEFDIERPPDLNKSTYLQDVHCVSSLCKAYFRELPNPLLTYQLYDKFADAVAIQLEEQRLIKIREVLKELPLPHYRTLEYLMRHLLRMASNSSQTNMHARNLAIVWAPNLLRSKDIESSGFNGTAAFMEVRVQSIVVEFILTHVEQLFGDWINYGKESEESTFASVNWPTCVPEDYYRSLSYNLPNMLNHGDGPPQIRPYHTIIEFSDHKRKGSLKAKKWKSIFNLGRSNPESKRKSQKQDDKDGKSGKMSLRPAKSMDSLSSVPHVTHGSDLGQSGVALRSPKNQLSLRRESLGSPSNEENVEFIFLDSGEQNNAECEEEGQAKSEPTTPKPGRSAITGKPPGRSPKSNQSRAEKCVGVHISGPFSVTLPFHITSNLSRLTRGMECPGLSIMVPQSSSGNFFSLEANLSAESDDTDKVTLSQMAEKENAAEEAGTENARISLEVQDSFSFLDVQDTSIEKTPENTVDSEMLGYELQAENKMEEFSVEPPPDDLCTEDEAEQMYFMPTGFVDEEGLWRQMHESLEDIYLSAHDDLSPITQAPEINLENKELCIFHENLPTNTDRVDGSLKEDQPRFQDVAYRKKDPHLLTGTETPSSEIHDMLKNDHHSQHCNSDDGATKEACREESAHVELCAPITDLQEDTTLVDPDSREESAHVELCAPITHLQEDTTLVDPESREESEHVELCAPITNLQEDTTLVDPESREESKHVELCAPITDLQEDTTLVDPDSREESEHVELCAPITDLQEDTTLVDPDCREESAHVELCAPITHLQEDTTLVDPDSREESEHVELCAPITHLQEDTTLVDPDSREESEHVELCAPITHLQEDTTLVDPDSREESAHVELCALITDLQEDTTLVDPDSREVSEHIELCAPITDLQEDTTLLDPGSREGQNMDLLHAENRSGMSAHEGIQHKRLGHDDMEMIKGKEFQDCSVPPTHDIAENNMDCTVDLHHVCHREEEGILEAPLIFQQPHVQKLNINLSKTTLENCDCEDEDDSVETNPDQHDGGKSMSSITPSLTHVKTSKRQNHCPERRPAEDLESTTDSQCHSDDDPQPCMCSSAEEAIGDHPLCDQMGNPEEKLKDFLQQEETAHVKTNEEKEAYLIGQRLPRVSKSLAELDGIVPGHPERKHPTGSVAMKLMATTNKIQQAKSVPVVPPKPQFTKLPPALKSKIQVSSSSSAQRDTRSQKMEKSNHLDTSETSTDSAPKRRSSWRNATSVSFDTAMALAKERQCQNPVRRMQTYCIGDSYEVMDTTKADNAPQAPRFTVKSASSRTHRPFSCTPLSYGELHGPLTVEKETMHGLHPIFNHEPEPYTKEVPHRNRLSMPRLGQPSLADEQGKCHQQRRSLL